mmetsp:Transcript_3830/g.5119  ORF Transcript_3830/g.5119 Transcript_3830/m.5119 type:complete len:171 (+) Transcript_3830:909-1421(+)
MVNSISSLEDVEAAIEYLEKRFESYVSSLALKHRSCLIFDNINGLCSKFTSEQPGSMVEQVKSERITNWLLQKVEANPETSVGIIARHFSLVNDRLLDVCCFDNLIELQAPTKQERYLAIKDIIAPESFASQEVKLLTMAQQTEYFLAKDLYALAQDPALTSAELRDEYF